jgi:hypothetical protein
VLHVEAHVAENFARDCFPPQSLSRLKLEENAKRFAEGNNCGPHINRFPQRRS